MLDDLEARPVKLAGGDLGDGRLFLGEGDAALEVVVVTAKGKPRASQLQEGWRARWGGRAAPVMLVAVYGEKAGVCAPLGSEPHVELDLELGTVERFCRVALNQPDRHAVHRLFGTAVPEMRAEVPGLRNDGLFATHELHRGVPTRKDWAEAREKAQPLLRLRDKELIKGLGFQIQPLKGPASVLVTGRGAQVAVAVFLERSEVAEVASERFGRQSPVMYALAKADEAEVDYVVVSSASGLRLYSTKPGAGVGARGRAESFTDLHLDLLREEHAGYLWVLFSADALGSGGTAAKVLENSRRYATDLGRRLRQRIYSRVIPRLAEALFEARGLKDPTVDELHFTYRMALNVLFRLLFVAYAEDQDLLPYRTNEAYRHRALKTKARELLEGEGKGGGAAALWAEVKLLFRAIDEGKPEWGIPTYNGGLFSNDTRVSEVGAAVSSVELSEELFVEAFFSLLVDEGIDGRGPVDFRSLGVRDFGTIYEGLLENDLSIAAEDLSVDKDQNYRPCKKGEVALVSAGQAYLGTASGKRKETGSYFTKAFLVDHLLDCALEPSLAAHLARLNTMSEREAGEAFFDFRVTDIAMGSAHFLVGAIDRIERGLSRYLVERPLPDVRDELERLRKRALEALGVAAGAVDLDDSQLLRRQIARRCVYGIDVNPDAVELARLSVWIHTFVPGLPLSVLDHHLVVGNSLVGIGTLTEGSELIAARNMSLFQKSIEDAIAKACEPAARLARLSEADAAEVQAARKVLEQERASIAPAAALFDVLAATRLNAALDAQVDAAVSLWRKDPKTVVGSKPHQAARSAFAPLTPSHIPLLFPEVFLRARPGFDVILGNPPWEEATIEEDDFWTRWDPGFQGLPQHEREARRKRYRAKHPDRVAQFEGEQARAEAYRHALVRGPFPGMGTGDPDTYKAFTWRFWRLCARDGGRIGVVLPRSAFAAKGSTDWRKEILAAGQIEDLTFLTNRGWVFDDVHPQYTIALMTLRPEPWAKGTTATIPLRGPFASLERFLEGRSRPPVLVDLETILSGTDTAAFPLLPAEGSADVWLQMRKSPRLDLVDRATWRARPYAELHATNDKGVMKFAKEQPDGYWPVYKGESFDVWESDSGSYYAWAEPGRIQKHLQARRVEAGGNKNSPFSEFPKEWLRNPKTLPCLHPRVAFRDVSRATDSRTVRAALLPPNVVITNKGPYFLWPRGDERDQAFLLGILSSIPLDWYARRFVEVNLNYHVLNPLPVPRPKRDDARWKRVVALCGRLAAQDRRFRAWAKAVGVECGRLSEDAKNEMVAELDAVAADLFGLTEKQLIHVFETFHEGWDWRPRLGEVLGHYRSWKTRTRT